MRSTAEPRRMFAASQRVDLRFRCFIVIYLTLSLSFRSSNGAADHSGLSRCELVRRSDCPLHPLDGRRETPDRQRMTIRAMLAIHVYSYGDQVLFGLSIAIPYFLYLSLNACFPPSRISMIVPATVSVHPWDFI